MRRITLLLLVIFLVVLATIASVGTFLPHQMMMPRMMGERYGGYAMMLWPAILTTSLAAIVGAAIYTIAFPNIRYSGSNESGEGDASADRTADPLDIVIRVSKPDERAVLQFLKQRGGICYQKDITYKTGLSKLKTHRIVARLAERGIIQVRKAGKTNQIIVPAWLRGQQSPPEPALNSP